MEKKYAHKRLRSWIHISDSIFLFFMCFLSLLYFLCVFCFLNCVLYINLCSYHRWKLREPRHRDLGTQIPSNQDHVYAVPRSLLNTKQRSDNRKIGECMCHDVSRISKLTCANIKTRICHNRHTTHSTAYTHNLSQHTDTLQTLTTHTLSHSNSSVK